MATSASSTDKPELVFLPYSPWSIKAKWALDHHGIDCKKTYHMPMLGELKLRRRLGNWTGRASLPVLFDGGRWFTDSFDIAKHADEIGTGAPLFPPAHLDEIAQWNDLSEAALRVARQRVMKRTMKDSDALNAQLPFRVPAFAKPAGALVGKLGVAFLNAKYGGNAEDPDLRKALDDVRETLEHNHRLTLLPTFSYADIAMAVVLQAVQPVDHPSVKLHPAARDIWRDPELAKEYADLLHWRDQLYRGYRN